MLPWLLLTFAGFLIVALGFAWRRSKSALEAARAGAAKLEAQLAAQRSAPMEREYRVELFDLLWFPLVKADPAGKSVLEVQAGLPHCRACVAPLKSAQGSSEWACPKCGARRPNSVADLAVIDDVKKAALALFRQRHP
ncbi:MAG: hypothetical protein WC728_15485 [Elusimicrobiota bacterium]